MTIRLREIQRGDVPLINVWRNDPRVIQHLGANFLFIGPEVDERWFDAYLASRDRAVRLVIEADGQPIGCVNLTNIQAANRSAEFSIMIGDVSSWSKGFGAEATAGMLRHAFMDLNLHRVYLYVLDENARAIALYRRMGFKEEGRLRDAVFKNGAFRDEVVMAILRPDYFAANHPPKE